jgi:dTDP-4-dehydrorhamnose 3,5-epimerase
VEITDIGIAGAALLRPVPFVDDRGSFARVFCREEFAAAGLSPDVAQVNLSTNARAGTLRGLHLQTGDAAEAKLVRCIRGSLFDVLVDVRPGSPTYLSWYGVELSADNRLALLVPEGCAHGFQTLEDDTEALYQVSVPYTPGAEAGLRFDDPALGIDWPLPVSTISDKDRSWPLLAQAVRA